MARPRSFDYDEARRLRAEGLTYAEIGRRLGVSYNAAAVACDPAFRERQLASSRRAIETLRHPCFDGCGTLVWAHTAGHSGYCIRCFAARRRVVRHGTEHEYRYGCRCELCTKASSDAKRQRRQKSRIPCSHGCGTLVDSINRRRPDKPPECLPCALKRVNAARRKTAA